MRMKVLASLWLASLLCASLLFAQALPEMRMLPVEMRGSAVDGNQIGSSGLAGVHTRVLFGDPSKAGFYSILLFVPAHTTIQAHSHRDDRMATVVSGTWYFGYGDRFDAQASRRWQFERKNMIDHIILTVSNAEHSLAFCEAALAPLNIKFFMPYKGENGHPDLWGFGYRRIVE